MGQYCGHYTEVQTPANKARSLVQCVCYITMGSNETRIHGVLPYLFERYTYSSAREYICYYF